MNVFLLKEWAFHWRVHILNASVIWCWRYLCMQYGHLVVCMFVFPKLLKCGWRSCDIDTPTQKWATAACRRSWCKDSHTQMNYTHNTTLSFHGTTEKLWLLFFSPVSFKEKMVFFAYCCFSRPQWIQWNLPVSLWVCVCVCMSLGGPWPRPLIPPLYCEEE